MFIDILYELTFCIHLVGLLLNTWLIVSFASLLWSPIEQQTTPPRIDQVCLIPGKIVRQEYLGIRSRVTNFIRAYES